MKRALAGCLVLLMAFQPTLTYARQAAAPGDQAGPAAGQGGRQGGSAKPADIESLGLSFDRIKRILDDRPPSTGKPPLKLTYYVEVVGMSPAITLFTPQDVAPIGAIPYAPIRHADILRLTAPRDTSSGALAISSLVILGIMKLAEIETNRAKREKAAEERRKINEAERERQKKLEESGLVIKKSDK